MASPGTASAGQPRTTTGRPPRSGDAFATLESRLRHAITGEVHADIATRALYTSDASNYRILPAAVVAPRSLADLMAVTAVARATGIPITMRGTGTSIAGNAIGPGIVVDTSRHLTAILEIDPAGRTATVQPGVVLDDLNAAVARYGLRVGPDPSTHSRCTVGGMVGNDACGSHSVFWGTTAENVLGLEIVTVDGQRRAVGSVRASDAPALDPAFEGRLRAFADRHRALLRRELPPWPRRVSGYALDWLLPERGFDVARALVGTEGTCVLVSAITVRLVRVPTARALLVLGFADDVEAAAAVPPLLAQRPYTVESMTPELFDGWRDPEHLRPAGRAWLLVEWGGDPAAAATRHADALAATVGRRQGDADVAFIDHPGAQRALWRVREDGAGRVSRLADGRPAFPGFEDAAVPPDRLADFVRDLRDLLRAHDLPGTPYGHFGEGCVHLRVGFGLDLDGGTERLRRFMDDATDLVVRHGGTLSGEHGDGRARSALLPRLFSPQLIDAFRQWKALWDPDGLLNPGVLVDPDPITASLRRPRPTTLPVQPAFAYEHDAGDFRGGVERCIGVGRCVSHQGGALMCPSYRATGREEDSTRGRARLLQELLAGALVEEGWRSTAVLDALDLCLACKGCAADCPTGVDMATYKAEFLDHHYRGRTRPRSHYSLGWLPTWLRLTRRIPRLVNATMRFPLTRLAFALTAGIAAERAIPPLARETFVRRHRRENASATPPVRPRGRVVLWPDTFTNHLSPDVGHAAVRVLRAAGFEIAVPTRNVCCGLTWISTGQLDRARSVLRATLDAPEFSGSEPILVLEPSCAATLRGDLTELLPDDPRARSVAARVTTFAELLDGIPLPTAAPAEGRAIVQPHCHQQAVLGTAADQRVMAANGITDTELLVGCCGLAGNFGAERGHEEVSRKVAEQYLLPALEGGPGDTVLADGFSCRTQVAFLTGRRARHLAEVLADRLDGPVSAGPGAPPPG
jgi:FAD/FMN-containing dehydrogenase/Fe-S oxidoreductase